LAKELTLEILSTTGIKWEDQMIQKSILEVNKTVKTRVDSKVRFNRSNFMDQSHLQNRQENLQFNHLNLVWREIYLRTNSSKMK